MSSSALPGIQPGLQRPVRLLAALARNRLVRRAAIRWPGARRLAMRFVAGEDLAAAIATTRALNAAGAKVSLNAVGTHARTATLAADAAAAATEALLRIREERLDADVSVKPTRLGLDVDEALCARNLRGVLDVAAQVGGFVWIDMEESQYVEATLRLFEEARAAHAPACVGIALQSYLRGREPDLERLLRAGARIRLVKGGYLEPARVARRGAELDRAFRRDVELLLRRGTSPAVGTHDPSAIAWSRHVASEAGLDRGAFEFQLLHGIADRLRDDLVRAGYTVRCYVPYGSDWYAHVLGCVRLLPAASLRRWVGRLRVRTVGG